MDDRQAIAAAKTFVGEVYADEGVGSPRLEEFEHIASAGKWIVTTDGVLLRLCSLQIGDVPPTLLTIDGSLKDRARAAGCRAINCEFKL